MKQVDRDKIVQRWDDVEPLLTSIIARLDPGLRAEDVLTALQYGAMQLWVDDRHDGVCVTEIKIQPKHKTCFIYFLAGKRIQIWAAEAHSTIRRFAEHHGCKYLEFCGRPGWERKAKQYGYTEHFVLMRKKLE